MEPTYQQNTQYMCHALCCLKNLAESSQTVLYLNSPTQFSYHISGSEHETRYIKQTVRNTEHKKPTKKQQRRIL